MAEVLRGVAGWALALASIAGWSVFAARRLRLQPELSVPFSVCLIVLLLFTGGVCGLLAPAAWLAAGAGAALFVLSLCIWRESWKGFLSPGFLFLALFAAFIAFQVHDDRLSHNDDFNHWAVMVKNLLLRNALPDATVTAVDFSSYPPGTALFVYYINRVVGLPFSEGRLILAQNGMEILLLAPLFLCARKAAELLGKRSASIWAMLMCSAVLMFLYEFRALVVDVVNGLIGFCAFAGVLYLKDEPRKAAAYCAPVAAVGLLVKFSNIYYAAWALLALIWVNARAKKRGEKPAYGALGLGALFCALIVAAWFVHVRAAFGGVADTHSMNLSRILDVLRSWTADDVKTIARVCLSLATNLRKSSVLLTVFMNAAVIALAVWNRVFYKRSPARLLRSAAVADICYIGYQIMLFAAYLLSFPREEALRGASYGRYNMSVMIWIIGFLSIVIARELTEMGKARVRRAVYGFGFAAMVALALVVTGEGGTLLHDVPYEGTKQQAADAILSQYDFSQDDRFFVLAADEDSKQVASVFHFKVNRRVSYCNVAEIADLQALAERMAGCEYLIVLEEDAALETLLARIERPDGVKGAYTYEEVALAAGL